MNHSHLPPFSQVSTPYWSPSSISSTKHSMSSHIFIFMLYDNAWNTSSIPVQNPEIVYPPRSLLVIAQAELVFFIFSLPTACFYNVYYAVL